MALTIKDCKATPTRITVVFSDPVQGASATDPSNYSVGPLPPPSSGSTTFTLSGAAAIHYDPSLNAVRVHPSFDPTTSIPTPWPWSFVKDDSWIAVNVKNVLAETGPGIGAAGEAFPTLVDGEGEREIRQTTRAAEDAVAYPLLTEEVGYAPSPLAGTPSAPPSGGRGATSLGQTVTQAVSDVLGWKIKPDDPKGFVAALTASFTCSDFEGHTQCTWTPRTYAVQTDLSGGITGAQASLYSRAQDAVSKSLPLLDGLYPLDPEADLEDIAALKGVARSQLTEMVNELGVAGGPRVDRVNQYFQLLLLNLGATFPPPQLNTNPDQIGGTLGSLRDVLGVNFQTQDFVNTVQDEQNLSNFRILSDYVTSLAQSWINNLQFFGLNTTTPFFGTQLVLLSRQLGVVAESVDEVRFTLDSVFIGPAERQTLELRFDSSVTPEPLFAEDLFNWVQNFATEEGPRLIQDGGKYGVQFSFLPIAQKLQRLVQGAQDPNQLNRDLPPGFHTFRVQRALKQLGDELAELVNLATPISHRIEEEPSAIGFDALRQQVATLTNLVQERMQGYPPTLPTSPAIAAIPPLLLFPPQPVGTISPPLVITLFNVGTASFTVQSISPLIGDNTSSSAPGDFHIVEPQPGELPVLLAAQGTLAVSVAFSPTVVGKRSAILQVAHNGQPQQMLQIPLQGTGS
jgi:hypothetical protein